MFLSQEINIKLCKNYAKSYIYQILYKIRSIKSEFLRLLWETTISSSLLIKDLEGIVVDRACQLFNWGYLEITRTVP